MGTDHPLPSPPRAWLAAALSLFVPGLGQLYAGRPLRALLIWLAALAAGLIALYLVLELPPTALTSSLPLLVAAGTIVFAAWDAARSTRDAPAGRRWFQRWYALLPLFVIAAWLRPSLVGAVKANVIEAFRTPSGAMAPSLLIGDFFYVDRRPSARHDLHRGAVVVHLSVEDSTLKQVKRVVAMGGDTVMMRAGHLTVNGADVPEPYAVSTDLHQAEPEHRASMKRWQDPLLIVRDSISENPDLNDWGPLAVPSNTVLLLGDNRQASYDSRYYGPVPVNLIVGRPALIYYSFDPAAGESLAWLKSARWSRIGQPIR